MVQLAKNSLSRLHSNLEQIYLLLYAVPLLLILGKIFVEAGKLVEGGHAAVLGQQGWMAVS